MSARKLEYHAYQRQKLWLELAGLWRSASRDQKVLLAGAAIVFMSGMVQLILPLIGIDSAWPKVIALVLDGTFLPMLSRIMWKYGIFTRKRWGWAAIAVAWGAWLVALTGWLMREVF